MAKTIYSRTGRRGRVADPMSGLKRKRGGVYKPQAGSRSPSRGGASRGLPTDPSPAVRGQMRAQRGAELAGKQIRATGRATRETLGAALDKGAGRSASERGEDRLSRRSAIQQSGRVFGQGGVPMTLEQRDKRGGQIAAKQRARAENRKSLRGRVVPEDRGHATFQVGDGPERTIRGGATKEGGSISQSDFNLRSDFNRGIQQDAAGERFQREVDQNARAKVGATRGQERRSAYQDVRPINEAASDPLSAYYSAEKEMDQEVNQLQPRSQNRMATDYQITTDAPLAQSASAPVALQPQPAPVVTQPYAPAPQPVPVAPVVPPLYTDPNAPLPPTQQEQNDALIAKAQAAKLNADAELSRITGQAARRDQGLTAPGQVAPATPQFVGDPAAQATAAKSYLETLPGGDDILQTPSAFANPTDHSSSINQKMSSMAKTLESLGSPQDRQTMARQMLQSNAVRQLRQMTDPSFRFITAPFTSGMTGGDRAMIEGGLRNQAAALLRGIEMLSK